MKRPCMARTSGAYPCAPPIVRPGARIFLSGYRAQDVAGLPWQHVRPIVVGGPPGSADDGHDAVLTFPNPTTQEEAS